MNLHDVFLEHRAALERFLRARGAGDLVEDIVQDMWVKLNDLDPAAIASPLPYLFRMADNHLRDRARLGVRRRQREGAWGETHIQPDPDAETALLSREALDEANRELDLLGERTRSILIRYRLDGLTQKEIAGELGVSLSLVEKHLQRAYRALGALRRRWRQVEEGADGDR